MSWLLIAWEPSTISDRMPEISDLTVTWKDYLSGRERDTDTYRQCCLRFREAFEQQRTNITRVFEAKSPKVIACLGAGVLNDIPYEPVCWQWGYGSSRGLDA